MKRIVITLLLSVFFIDTGWTEREQIQLASLPSLSPDGHTLVFEYRHDLWIASSDGGEAKPLTLHPAFDTRPIFSPDGTHIAFMSNRDNTWQTYVIPLSGGTPRQLTFHSQGAVPRAWFPDGQSLIVTSDRAYLGYRQTRLFRVDSRGGKEPELLFNAYAGEVSLASDGEKLLFTTGEGTLYRKGYKGSVAEKIWLHNLLTGESRVVRDHESGCRTPMWKPDGSGFYYAGQQDGCFNIREYDLKSGEDKELTHFVEDSVILPTISANGKVMVFRNRFDFYRLDPRKPKSLQKINLWMDTDASTMKTKRRWYDKAWNNNTWGTLSTTDDGLELCFTAGGDLWLMDTVFREPVQVCGDVATHEREAVFSKDNASIYFLRDDGLGVNIWKAERKDPSLHWWENKDFVLSQITNDRIGRRRISLSPKGERLAVEEAGHQLWTMNLDGSDRRKLLDTPFNIYYDWSPDGGWLVCSARDSWGNSDIWIVDESGEQESYNLSRHPNWDWNPRWSPDGRIISYVGKRYDEKTDIYYVWLNREDEVLDQRTRTRILAKNKIKESRNEQDVRETDHNEQEIGDQGIDIDFEGLSRRVRRIQVNGVPQELFWSFDSKALAFQANINGKDGTWKVVFPDHLTPQFITHKKGIYARWLEKNSQILWLVNGVPSSLNQEYSFKLYNEVNLEAYRRLAFRIMWRELKDKFYDSAFNNHDWDAIRLKYEDQAATADSWDEFGKVSEMLMGELNASHLGYNTTENSRKEWNPGYESSQNWEKRTAALGLIFTKNHDVDELEISHVVKNSASDRLENPVQSGDVLLEIDGQKVGADTNLNLYLNGYYPRDINLLLRGTNGTERVVVVEADNFNNLRNLVREEWMEQNRETVERISGGRCGYLDIQKMDFSSLRQFEKKIYSTGFGKDGLVIDVRNNPGGFISDHLLSILCHPKHAITIPRNGDAGYQQTYLPSSVWFKPIVVLCNEYSSSNAEIFCHAIKTLNRGKVVGIPTQRSVISTNPFGVLDVGTIRVPYRGWFRLKDGADMDKQPCIPDVIVHNAPGDVPSGHDPQLIRAIKELLKDIEAEEKEALAEPIYASKESRNEK